MLTSALCAYRVVGLIGCCSAEPTRPSRTLGPQTWTLLTGDPRSIPPGRRQLTGGDQAPIVTPPLAPAQDVTVLRGAVLECGRRVEAGRLRPARRLSRHPTRWRLARSAGERHRSPGRGPGRWRR